MKTFDIVQQSSRKKKLKQLLALRKAFDERTKQLFEVVKALEMAGKKHDVLVFFLINLIRGWSINIISGSYKLLAKHRATSETIFPNSHKIVINAFQEILILQCSLMDRAFWEVQTRRWLKNRQLKQEELHNERNSYMMDVLKGVISAHKEFCQLLGSEIDFSESDFLIQYDERLSEHENTEDVFRAKEPKNTLLWEAGKNIAVAMLGGPDIAIVELVVLTGMENLISNRDFIAEYFGVKIEKSKKAEK